MKFERGKTYWANIPWDGPSRARAAQVYIGPVVVVYSANVSKDKVFVKLPIEHFFWSSTATKYVCINVDCLSEV